MNRFRTYALARLHQSRSGRVHGRAGVRGRSLGLCIQIPVCAVARVFPVTESTIVVVSTVVRTLTPARLKAAAGGEADGTASSCAVWSHLVLHGSGAKVSAAAEESGHDGHPLLGARGVIVGILIVWRWRRTGATGARPQPRLPLGSPSEV